MRSNRVWGLVALLVIGVAVGGVLVSSGLVYGVTGEPSDYNATTVLIHEDNGTDLTTVYVRVADTDRKRYVGLSETDSLRMGTGMWFVHGEEARQSYVMRNMSFPLDMVFVGANGTVTTIRHAPVPPEGTDDLERYGGTGKWVLEVPMGFTNETGVDVGDRVEVPPVARNTTGGGGLLG